MKTHHRSNSILTRKPHANRLVRRVGWLVILALLLASLLGEQWAVNAAAGAGGGQAPEESGLALPQAFGKPGSVSAVPVLGAVVDRLDLPVPPGRRSVDPRLTLTFNSLGGLGSLGLGWGLEIGSVEIWRGDGVPNVGIANSFVYSLAGAGGQLINTGAGVYRARQENLYREFRRSTVHGGWEMYNGEGVLHRFGGSANSRIEGKQWLLDLVQDPMGNTITYQYVLLDKVLYVSQIHYTGFAADNDLGDNLISFAYETRPDARLDLGLGLEQKKTQRLKQISMYAGGALARGYEFAYTTDPLSGLSLLDSVTLVGADGTSRTTLREMEYTTRSAGWQAGTTYSLPASLTHSDGLDTGNRLVDVNGDALTDLVKNDGWVFLGTGGGTLSAYADVTWSSSLRAKNVEFAEPSGDYKGLDKGMRLVDINADGLPDLLVAQMDRKRIYLNTGRGWSDTETVMSGGVGTTGEQWTTGTYGLNSIQTQATFSGDDERFALVGSEGDAKGVMLADVNGDSRVDIVWSFKRSDSLYNTICSWIEPECYPVTSVRGVFLNTGSGWKLNQDLTNALAGVGFFIVDSEWKGYDLLDVNGDGFADILRTLGGETLEVRLGTGGGWVLHPGFTASLSANNLITLDSDGKAKGLMPVDFNEDGLLDYFKANESSKTAYKNTGTGWAAAPEMTVFLTANNIAFATSEGKGTGTLIVDMNGDGTADIVRSISGSTPTIYWGQGLRSGLLQQVTSTLGEVTTITWDVSTKFNHLTESGVQGFPIILPVVTRLTRQDGRGGLYETTYSYSGGLYTGRQFRGFHLTQQVGPTGLKTISHYSQAEGQMGMALSVKSQDVPGTTYQERTAVYKQVDTGVGVIQTYLYQSDDIATDPGGTRHSMTQSQVDDRLNYLSTYRDPDADIPGDESIIKYSWVRNAAAGIWGLISKVQILDPDGNVLQEKITYYDELPENQATRGLPSRVLDLVEPGVYIGGSMAYDRYGNVTEVWDRENNLSTFAYDATGTFRVQAVDAEGRVSLSQFDPRFGQPTLVTDPAGRVGITEYDAYGRVKKVILPGDEASPFGTQTVTYTELGEPASQSYTVADTEKAGEPGTLESTYYFDGMGRVYKAERDADGGRKVVTLVKFDSSGNASQTTRPFFEGDPQVWTTVERDQFYRPVKVTDHDGSQVFMVYAGARVDIIDVRGVKTAYHRNTNGDVTKVEQWINGAKLVTEYTYDRLGRLTTIRDTVGEETHITYDLLGRRTQLVDPNVGIYEYRYDAEGNLVEDHSPDGSVAAFTYDRTGQLLSKQFSDGSRQEFIYDAAGQLIQVNDKAGVLTVGYDLRGRVNSRLRQVGGDSYQTQYAYDSMDRITSVTYPDGYQVHNIYGSGGNLLEVVDGNNAVIATGMTYTASGQLLEIQYGNGVTSSMTYDELLRMQTTYTWSAEEGTIQDLAYSYDANGNILSITDLAFGASQTYEYDDLERLVKATGLYGVESYEYDVLGNLLRKGDTVFGYDPEHPQRLMCGVDTSLIRGNANGIENNPHTNTCDLAYETAIPTKQKDSPSKRGGRGNPNIHAAFEVVYDANGNAVQKGDTLYEYDQENHLVRILDAMGKLVAENVYDAGGQRVLQITPEGTRVYIDGIYEVSKTHVTRHVMAGPLLVSSIVRPGSMAAASEDMAPSRFNALAGMAGLMGMLVCLPYTRTGRQKWLSRLGALKDAFRAHPYRMLVLLFILNALVGTAAAPEYAAMASPSYQGSQKVYYYHPNHLGSINVITDDQGQVVERREYKPYGEPYLWSGPNSGPQELLTTFQGQKFDDATGLYYMGARHYDPTTGRFLAADTKVSDPNNPQTLNRYAFVGGNPVRYTDPTGHDWCKFVIAALIVVAVIVLAVITVGFALGPAAIGGALLIIGIFALVGAVIGAVVALATGNDFGSLAFWEDVAAGVMFGAIVGAGIAVLPSLAAVIPCGIFTSSGSIAWGAIVAKIAGGAVIGAATGIVTFGVQNIAIHIAGGTPDRLFSLAFFEAIAWGAAFGAAFGVLSLGAASAATSYGARSFVPQMVAKFSGMAHAWRISSWTYRAYVIFNTVNVYMLAPGIGWGSLVSPSVSGLASWCFTARYGMAGGGMAMFSEYVLEPMGQAIVFMAIVLVLHAYA